LRSLALLFHYLMLNMFRMLIHPSSGACDLFVELFRGLYCSASMCVSVTLWFGCGGVVSVRGLTQCSSKQSECTVLYCHLRHVRAYNIFPHLINGTNFGKNR